jgi:hypothetical protein
MVRALSTAMIVVAMTVAVSAFAKNATPHQSDAPSTPSITEADQDDDPG